MSLTDKQRKALEYASVYMRKRFVDPRQTMETCYGEDWNKPQVWSALRRLGLVNAFANSEQVRYERRQNWIEYRITAAGVAALTNPPVSRERG